ncbi:hypothetical protein [Thermoflavimicrobium dichotomicum]|uniref:Flp pilus-assembly TadE/G-like n=1 Tax=Thermoflavimicrobium dichotomicum TaxID=46223 RepID=A0A1I3QRU2_9BACL|nr:hypothetical protein [Thermoflavimicrobium dichotomicum]SFJ36605.1 hypothetical protein SAMN05421852_10868 [Thermoflavimicrobium dichotomicum]
MIWMTGLPVFMILFLFLTTLIWVWSTYYSIQLAADAASVALTNQMDLCVKGEVQRIRQQSWGWMEDPIGTPEKKNELIQRVIEHQQDQLKSIVHTYMRKNQVSPHGQITFFYNQRIKVTVHQRLNIPFLRKEVEIYGSGTGPSHDYMAWLISPIVISY